MKISWQQKINKKFYNLVVFDNNNMSLILWYYWTRWIWKIPDLIANLGTIYLLHGQRYLVYILSIDRT